MSVQTIVALCEGPHDVAFLSKTLKSFGFKSNEKTKLSDYPSPMNSILTQEAIKADVEELNIQTVRQSLLPSNALLRDDIHILLYIVGGDSKGDLRKEFIGKLKSVIRGPGEIRKGRVDETQTLSVIYFFDADEKGVLTRLAEVKREVGEVLEMSANSFEANGSVSVCEGLKVGCFIFSGDDNNTGKLEDILIPLMTEGNEIIFAAANKFLDEHHDDSRLYPMKLIEDGGAIIEKRSNKAGDRYRYDRAKSVVGTVGQLQQSGAANTVCIGYTDYLGLEKIRNHPKCQEISRFVQLVIEP